jgi:hypothetical protein
MREDQSELLNMDAGLERPLLTRQQCPEQVYSVIPILLTDTAFGFTCVSYVVSSG